MSDTCWFRVPVTVYEPVLLKEGITSSYSHFWHGSASGFLLRLSSWYTPGSSSHFSRILFACCSAVSPSTSVGDVSLILPGSFAIFCVSTGCLPELRTAKDCKRSHQYRNDIHGRSGRRARGSSKVLRGILSWAVTASTLIASRWPSGLCSFDHGYFLQWSQRSDLESFYLLFCPVFEYRIYFNFFVIYLIFTY